MTTPFFSWGLDGTTRAALIAVRATAEAMDGALVTAARARGWLIFDVEIIDPGVEAWHDDALPGLLVGCFVRMQERDVVHVRTDAAGQFFAATADLLLRSNGIGSLYIVGTAPDAFLAALEQFGRRNGYPLELFSPPSLPEPDHEKTLSAPGLLPDFASRIACGNAALLLIDVQNDFCAPAGATGRTGQPMAMISQAVDRIKKLLTAAREAGIFVVHVRAEYGELYRYVGSPYRFPTAGGREPAVWTASAAEITGGTAFPSSSVEVCLPGSWGGDFVDGLEPRPGEAVITKHRFSAFADTGLDLLLRAHGIKSVVVAGVTTNCCVETTAREAVMRDFYLVVAADCVAVKDHLRDLHDATLESLGLYFGLVRPSADIVDAWARTAGVSARPGVAA